MKKNNLQHSILGADEIDPNGSPKGNRRQKKEIPC